jgi:uncharacterized protein (TIGR02246 family)
MATLEEQVAGLLDREAIRSLVNMYCKAVWDRDPDAFASLWVEDGALVVSGNGMSRTISGRANLRAMITQSLDARPPGPLVHNHVVTVIDDAHAVGEAYVEVLDRAAEHSKSATAHYRDDYLKVAEAWRFQRRELRFASVSATIAAAYRPKPESGVMPTEV